MVRARPASRVMIAYRIACRPGRRRALRAGTAAGRSGWPDRPGCRPLTPAVFAGEQVAFPVARHGPAAGLTRRPRHGLSPFHTVPLPFQAADPSPIQARSEWAALRWQHSHHRHHRRNGSAMNSTGHHGAAHRAAPPIAVGSGVWARALLHLVIVWLEEREVSECHP